MSSIIEGYNYDIFISYRQKDNKYDGWVTEFVEHLTKEIEATFKEDISIYFDINPHDGLLETHDVDESLKEKLRCLIFIPIISRTYCDPKCFAWEHEFNAFIKQASGDSFGLKIKLPNGNVASRVLPIRIHDLDPDDIRLCESITGGFLRGVEFIYKEPGVNRPLRAKEDKPLENLNKTLYRNQINKVAISIKELIGALKQHNNQVTDIIDKEISSEELRKPSYVNRKKRIIILFSLLLFCASITVTYKAINHGSIKKHIYTITIPEVSMLYDSAVLEGFVDDKCWKAFIAISEAGKKLPGDTIINSTINKLARKVCIYSEPPGAEIFGKPYTNYDASWYYFGKTPLQNIMIPKGASIFNIIKSGYSDQNDAFFVDGWDNQYDTLFYKLLENNDENENIVLINGRTVQPNLNQVSQLEPQWVGDFIIDKTEVTNKEYKRFLDEGGYLIPRYWKRKFIKDGKQVSWKEAMAFFRDKSGWQGPSTWISGQFPAGEANKPVSGISWYEAAAYADFCNKSLPTIYHWCAVLSPQLIPLQAKNSNFGNNIIADAGTYKGTGRYGLYDVLGNVREWIYNQINDDNYVAGGSAHDPVYSVSQAYFENPWERDKLTGFRCIRYVNDTNRMNLEQKFNYTIIDKSADKPVPENLFKIFSRQFDYSVKPINVIKSSITELNGWKQEKVTIDAGYEGPDMEVNIYFPKNVNPPYQTVIIFPGDDAIINIPKKINDYPVMSEFLLISGRVVIMPQYMNTYGRGIKKEITYINFKEGIIKRVNDLRRTIDYLETRKDIDINRLAFLGVSWGTFHAPYILSVEKRIDLGIMDAFGLSGNSNYPEFYHINYLPRVKIPMLLLSGKYDYSWNYVEQSLYFKWLGTPEIDKKWILYESIHGVPMIEVQKESLLWLDKYFGNPLNR